MASETAPRRPLRLFTARLCLREFTLADAPQLYELCRDPEVVRYTGDAPCPDLEEAKRIVAYIMTFYDRTGMGRLAVEIGDTGEFLGWCGIRPQEGVGVDLGFRLHRRCWGRGYATEAARATLDFGLGVLGLDRIVGRVDPANSASERVLIKLGMRYVGEVDDADFPSRRMRIYEATRRDPARGG